MRVLGLETSCDDTGVAVYDAARRSVSHRLFSQIDLHTEYGGVVPELASRDHIRKVLPLIREVLKEHGIHATEVDGIAYTAGPGLAGALLVGAAVGRSLAMAWNIPAIGINHMEGHLLSPLLEAEPPEFPFLALLVSGGHTMLADVRALGDYRVLGESLDDAAGEAFDKVAKLLGLGYPGGPAIERACAHGRATRFHFPRPMARDAGLDFSFSGLKTACAQTISKLQARDPQTVADVAAAFQEAAIDTLVIKTERALQQTGYRQLVVAGGVSANRGLRDRLDKLSARHKIRCLYPRLEFCTDNGAMIAFAGYLRLRAGQHEMLAFGARARWRIEDLPAV